MNSEYKKLLKTSVCTVKFTKKDGSIREMNCTLLPEILPVKEIKEGVEKKEKTENPNLLIVFDIDKNAWRSIIVDSIISFEKRVFSIGE